jgi:hypothetical protein
VQERDPVTCFNQAVQGITYTDLFTFIWSVYQVLNLSVYKFFRPVEHNQEQQTAQLGGGPLLCPRATSPICSVNQSGQPICAKRSSSPPPEGESELHEVLGTVFGEPRKDESLRLINNFKGLNKCFSNNKFNMDNWTTLRNALRNRALRYGLTLDLKSWFHHLAVHPANRR